MSRAQELMPIDRSQPEEIYMPLGDAQRDALDIEERFIPGLRGAPDVRVLVYRRKDASETLPVLLHLHGGGFVILRPESFAGTEGGWALDHRCVVVSVDYRLAPEHCFPAAPDDCYAALLWTVEGEDYDREKTSPSAAPARAESLAGLPPAFIQTNGLDPLRDEGIQYAMRLMAEGIDVELYNAPGCYHGADPLDPRAMLQAARVYNEALGAALNPS